MERPEATCRLRPSKDEELRRQGWTFRFTASGARLREMVEAYESMGFEVHLEPIKPEEVDEACRACIQAEPETIYAVYTRPRREGGLEEDLYE
ncbi:MAG: hypothetical protein DRJ97_02200 [Thermoprotei archaeon]|nr:MAG: hypothetical protein DRJ97_02200 [Thermoprotei archaeon]